ncbi:PIN domain-containing protein [Curtobacterium sp. 'Ferrero']|uniref:PIN domain-containing protein n=1 Tax=Curtobacterium sp. 'Ferrero' TaxID=2033654 RepID=UPI001596CD4B|nr:PIN domain-containing protein [Curtobacterium sp. 'Ferrero']
MILILDANVLVSNPMLRGAFWDNAAEAINGARLKIIVPRLAVDEAVAVYKRTRAATAVSIRKERRRASEAVRTHLDAAADEALAEGERYEQTLHQRFAAVGVTVDLAVPIVEHRELARRAINRIRPFSESGTGYRDALHWWFVLDTAEQWWEEDDVIFVSSDLAAFALKSDGKAALHPQLLDDILDRNIDPVGLDWVPDLTKVSIPGVFLSDEDAAGYGYSEPDDLEYRLMDHLLAGDPPSLSPADVGLDDVDAVRLVDAGDPKLLYQHTRVYYGTFNLHINFEVRMNFDVVTQTLVDDSRTPELVESSETTAVVLTGTAELSHYGTDLEFSIDDISPYR